MMNFHVEVFHLGRSKHTDYALDTENILGKLGNKSHKKVFFHASKGVFFGLFTFKEGCFWLILYVHICCMCHLGFFVYFVYVVYIVYVVVFTTLRGELLWSP